MFRSPAIVMGANLHLTKRTTLVVVFSLALGLRLVGMIALESYNIRSDWAFGYEYGGIAKWVALGEGFSSPYLYDPKPSAIAAPGYVYFIAFIFSVFGIFSTASAIVIQGFQSIAAALTCAVFYLLGKKMLDETTGILSAVILAFYPPGIFFSIMRIGPVVLVVLLIATIIYLFMNICERQDYRTTAVCGFLIGLTALIEPTVLLFFPLLCGWLLFSRSLSAIQCTKHVFMIASIAMLCIAPWTVRNYLVFDKFVLIKSPIGMNLLYGNNPFGNGIVQYTGSQLFSSEEREKMKDLDEVAKDRFMSEKAISYIRENPAVFIERTLKRITVFWTVLGEYRQTRFDLLRNVIYGTLVLLACIGSFLAYRNSKFTRVVPLFLFFLSYPLTYYVTHVTFYRYRYPVEPFLIVLASYALVEFSRYTQRKRNSTKDLLSWGTML